MISSWLRALVVNIAMFIRLLKNTDYNQWLPLWQDNCLNQVPQNVTEETWRRICDPKENVFGLGVFEEENLIGILHYILHPTTGQLAPVCYMQDLYIRQDHRRKGHARALVTALQEEGTKAGWARIYWLAEKSNPAAQNLYKNLGIPVDFSLHILPL